MNAPVKITPALNMDDAHLLRSKLIERFAQFEALVFQLVAVTGVSKAGKSLVGQRIEAVTTALASKSVMSKQDKRLADMLEKAAPFLALRNELAHGTMALATLDGETVVLVKNVNSALLPLDQRTVIRPVHLTEMTRQLATLNNQLKQLITPPSPPPPSPGAAAAP